MPPKRRRRARKPRIRVKPDGTYHYIYSDNPDIRAAQEEWERCNPPRGPKPEDNRPTS